MVHYYALLASWHQRKAQFDLLGYGHPVSLTYVYAEREIYFPAEFSTTPKYFTESPIYLDMRTKYN